MTQHTSTDVVLLRTAVLETKYNKMRSSHSRILIESNIVTEYHTKRAWRDTEGGRFKKRRGSTTP